MQKHGPFLYLMTMATQPGLQSQGLGSQLLDIITARADKLGCYCYIEASTERSRELYKRYGFVDRAIFQYKPASPTMYIMARPPVGVAAGEALAAPASADVAGKDGGSKVAGSVEKEVTVASAKTIAAANGVQVRSPPPSAPPVGPSSDEAGTGKQGGGLWQEGQQQLQKQISKQPLIFPLLLVAMTALPAKFKGFAVAAMIIWVFLL